MLNFKITYGIQALDNVCCKTCINCTGICIFSNILRRYFKMFGQRQVPVKWTRPRQGQYKGQGE